jgi:hypothetical protein
MKFDIKDAENEYLSLPPEEQKTYLESMIKKEEKVHASLLECAKGVGVLNSGGVAAMLAFIQALIGKGEFTQFKTYSLVALSIFLLGAVTSWAVFMVHARGIMANVIRHPSRKYAIVNMLFALTMSLLCFLVAAVVIVIGLAKAY